jgi:hypothetical protein
MVPRLPAKPATRVGCSIKYQNPEYPARSFDGVEIINHSRLRDETKRACRIKFERSLNLLNREPHRVAFEGPVPCALLDARGGSQVTPGNYPLTSQWICWGQ